MQETPTLIIGAGLTGLSCALHLGDDYVLVEKEESPGGVVRTRFQDGFAFDGTGHWLHLRNPEMRRLVENLLPGALMEYERRAVIHLYGAFTPYPFQANTYGLPREVVLECLLGLMQARHPEDFGLPQPEGEPRHFRESVERLFGPGICRHFMVPYNEKLLGVKLEEISAAYATRFIPRPSLEDVVRGALGFSREALGYNARFVYPSEGGIGALPKALAAALREPPRYKTAVAAVDLPARVATLTDGAQVHYTQLLNTMPLVDFSRMLGPLPPPVAEALGRLRATTVYYFDVAVRGPATAAASDYHWVYFPEPEFIFYRAGSYSAVHAGAAPPGCRSYYVEMAGGIAEWLSRPEALSTRVLDDMRRAQMLSAEDEVLFMELRSLPSAYVIFDQYYEASRRTVIDFLQTHGIHSAGRWGGWNYGGMEDALLEGKAAAEAFGGRPK